MSTTTAATVESLEVEEHGFTRRDGHITALQNGLAVLDMFDHERGLITVAEIGRQLGIHKSTASRIASTLVAAGFLRPALVGTGFQLSAKLTRLGHIAAADTNLTSASLPYLRAIVDELGETCHLGVLEGREAVTVALMDGTYSIRLHSVVGKRNPANCTAMGKVLLSELDKGTLDLLYKGETLPHLTRRSVATKTELIEQLGNIRKRGYAIDDEELEVGLRCVAAPVRDHDNNVVASLTIAGSASRISMETISDYAQRVRFYADQISLELGAPSALHAE